MLTYKIEQNPYFAQDSMTFLSPDRVSRILSNTSKIELHSSITIKTRSFDFEHHHIFIRLIDKNMQSYKMLTTSLYDLKKSQ